MRAQKRWVSQCIPESGPVPVEDDLLQAITEAVSGAVRAAERAGEPVLKGAEEVAGELIDAAMEAGREVGQAARGIAAGMVRGTSGERRVKVVERAARAAVSRAAMGRADAVAVANGFVQGAIEAATGTGGDAVASASAAVRGSIKGARDASRTAELRVCTALSAFRCADGPRAGKLVELRRKRKAVP